MSISTIPSSSSDAITTGASVVVNSGAVGGSSTSNPNEGSDSVQNLWKFGASTFRIGDDGNVRPATQEEILSETRSSPAAMVQVLSTGADLLRFDANGRYAVEIETIALLYRQDNKTSDEIATEVRIATESLRNQMREDIKTGVFTLNDSGQAFLNSITTPPEHEPIALAQEAIGFELNALFIESLADKIGQLAILSSQLATVDSFVQDNLGDDDQALALFDQQSNFRIESREEFDGGTPVAGSAGEFDTSHNALNDNASNKAIADDLETWRTDETHETEFDLFVEESFSDLDAAPGDQGQTLYDSMRDDYLSLLEGSGLATPEWIESLGDEDPKAVLIDGDQNILTGASLGMVRVDTDRGLLDRKEDYWAVEQERKANQFAFGATKLAEARENVNSRQSTLATLSEQIGTNFSLDNTRFNNLIEAMNSYNTSVVDSLRRFSII